MSQPTKGRGAALAPGSRYELLVKIATGGTATVYVGRASGSVGFTRLVAIKRAHPHLRDDPKARASLVREARLASGIHHANVVGTHDVEETDEELLLVMDYVEGGALSDLLERSQEREVSLPARVVLRILLDACAGLTAVHALTDDTGRELGMVHRDVSPQNVLVGVDGTARLTDFGLARVTEVSASATATVKGKIAYMAPEYIEGAPATQRSDVFSMGVMIWEALACRRLFRGNNDADTLRRIVSVSAPALSTVMAGQHWPEELDAILERALAKRPEQRYASMAELNAALSEIAPRIGVGSHAEVGRTVRELMGADIRRRRETLRALTDPENATGSLLLSDLPYEVPPSQPPMVAEPTVRLAQADDPAPARPHAPRLGAVVGVSVLLAAGALGYWFWPRSSEVRHDASRMSLGNHPPLLASSNQASVKASAPTATAALPEPSKTRPRRAPPGLPRNPYKDRVPP